MRPPPGWQVGCDLAFTVEERAEIALQVAVTAVEGRTIVDGLEVTLDGEPLPGVREVAAPYGGRIHHLEVPPGRLEVTYGATASGPAAAGPAENQAYERLLALRPSRYCPSDALLGFAAGELGDREPGPDLVRDVVRWVHQRIVYAPGTSGPLDTAVETLLAGQGVCRDFAHLGVGLARAVGVPARLVAAYAPGLSPMDFHAVVEAHVAGAWHVFDPTHLAPRSSLLRVATGRDAADTAFADVLTGIATLTRMEVRAVCDGPLPADDWDALVSIA